MRAPRRITLVPGGSCLLRAPGFLRGAGSPHFVTCGAMKDGMVLGRNQEPAVPQATGHMAFLPRKEELLFRFREATLALLQPCPSSRGKESMRPGVCDHLEPAPLSWSVLWVPGSRALSGFQACPLDPRNCVCCGHNQSPKGQARSGYLLEWRVLGLVSWVHTQCVGQSWGQEEKGWGGVSLVLILK